MMRLTGIAIALVAAFCLGVPGCDGDGTKAPLPPGSVEGTVTEAESAEPVGDAFIVLVDVKDMTVASALTQTDAEGHYRIDGMEPGSYAALVLHDSLVVREKPTPQVQVQSNKVTDFDISLVYFEFAGMGGYRIEGVVTDAETLEPVPGAYVGLALINRREHDLYAAGLALWSTVTDSLGQFSLAVIPLVAPPIEGLFPISVTKEGYEPFTLIGEGYSAPPTIPPLLPLPGGDDRTLEAIVTLRPLASNGTGPHGAGAIKGRLMSFGDPVAGVLVGVSIAYVSEPDTFRDVPVNSVPMPKKVARTDRLGDFRVAGLTPGYYWIDPAFPENDGYVRSAFYSPLENPFSGHCLVEDSLMCDLGVLEVGRAISPVNPPNRSTGQSTTPEFRWSAIPNAPGLIFVGYDIQYGTGYILDAHKTNLSEPLWQVPASKAFAPGDNVRWTAIARAYNPATEDTVRVGEFEWPATFSVAP